MKRIDKIYSLLKLKCSKITMEDEAPRFGFDAMELADELMMMRNNVSKELNNLVRLNKVIKIKSRPVLYMDRERFYELTGKKVAGCELDVDELKEYSRQLKIKNSTAKENTAFDLLIGHTMSLKNQIDQAKAAILYPPGGLHTLILGQTGVGKTTFANIMYSYAKQVGKIGETAPFIVFNCADYYSNPQLLISQIFGHVKGSFTGALEEKSGLIERADNGILFLDEIHRMPPEGQEMLFYFMDTGFFNKLGEVGAKRTAAVLIISATTEDPDSSLLKTFTRRIPIVITIPTFEQRPLIEKILIIKHLFLREAIRIHKNIEISSEAMKAILGSVSYGNVGQLRSNIQLVCARGFLDTMSGHHDNLTIDFKMLPSAIKSGFFKFCEKRKDNIEIAKYIDETTLISFDRSGEENDTLLDDNFNIYKEMEKKVDILKYEGMENEDIKKFITTDIELYIKSFYNNFKADLNTRDRILKIVDEEILTFVEEAQVLAEQCLDKKYTERFLYAFSLHISALLKRLGENKNDFEERLEDFSLGHSKEYEVAVEIKSGLEKKFNIVLPESENNYLALLLCSIHDTNEEHIRILVAAHGNSTATSMVNVVTKLMGDNNMIAINMPLDVPPNEVLEQMIDKLSEFNNTKGVLLLVDMGSLTTFGGLIEEKTGIKIRTVDMVSTPLIIEALRRSTIKDIDLDSLYLMVKEFKGYTVDRKDTLQDTVKEKIIVTICSSGKGTAETLKELIKTIVGELTKEDIKIMAIGLKNMKKELEKLQNEYKILAITGIVDPKISVPFISIEDLIQGKGELYLKNIISGENITITNKENIVIKDLCEEHLKQFLTYLNPYKAMELLIKFVKSLEENLNESFNNAMKFKLIVHTALALERMIIHDGLVYPFEAHVLDSVKYEALEKSVQLFKDSLRLELSYDEKMFILDLLNS